MAAASLGPLGQLPRGRHGLSPRAVEADQRRRMLDAAAVALDKYGYASATVARVIEEAGVSRRTFYQQFDDRDACLLAAYEDAERRIWTQAAAVAVDVERVAWPLRVQATLSAILDFLAAEPATARLFTLEARAALPEIAVRQRRALDRVASALRAGNRARPHDRELPERTEATLLGNVAALVGAYVLSGATELLPGLTAQLADHLLLPYTEAEEAGVA